MASTYLYNQISNNYYYETYHGHIIEHLRNTLTSIKINYPENKIIYLAGDSSLDNKYWINEWAPATNAFNFLKPSFMKKDICYHLNKLGESNGISCINTSVEATTLEMRVGKNNLLKQDYFIKNNISEKDILIVSIGGNDIALNPTFKTIWNLFKAIYLNNEKDIKLGPSYAYGLKHLVELFKNNIEEYIEKLVARNKPEKIVVCMVYYPCEIETGSWSDRVLYLSGYNSNPKKLQVLMNTLFKYGTCNIKIRGSKVIPFPMFKYMDSKCVDDYVQRVEPSSKGGEKIAKGLLDIINEY